MIELKHLTTDECAGLDRRLPVIIPIGLVEAHGAHLAVSVDLDTAEYFSRRLAEATGAILAPALPYGYADEMAEYPGTMGVTAATLTAVYRDIACGLCAQGFTRQLWLSGHGANAVPFNAALEQIWARFPAARINYWNYWTEAGVTGVSHADRIETEIALAVGTVAHMDRVRDHRLAKPWYRIRSRYALQPDSGGINGVPSQARREQGEAIVATVVEKLSARLNAIITSEMSGPAA